MPTCLFSKQLDLEKTSSTVKNNINNQIPVYVSVYVQVYAVSKKKMSYLLANFSNRDKMVPKIDKSCYFFYPIAICLYFYFYATEKYQFKRTKFIQVGKLFIRSPVCIKVFLYFRRIFYGGTSTQSNLRNGHSLCSLHIEMVVAMILKGHVTFVTEYQMG